jgi:hypothetical protein
MTSDKVLNTHRDVPRGQCSCKPQLFVAKIAYSPSSYPLAYSVLVLPFSVVRWSAYDHKRVPSAASFFAMSMYNLSGAVNVLLLVIVRPYLLLLTRPECRVSAGQPGLKSEEIAGTSTMLENPSVHSEMPLPPLMGRVVVLAPESSSSLDSRCCEAT